MVGVAMGLYRSATDPVFHSLEDVASSVEGAAIVEVPRVPLADRENIDTKILESPDSKYSEAIFALWQLIQSKATTQGVTKGRLIAVLSPAEGDGRSTIALNVARCAATAGKRTLLVHANLRYAENDNVLSRPGPSLADVIRGEAELSDATYQDAKSPLDICPAPVEPVRDAALLFNSDNFHNAVAEMQKAYDLIIFDTPSLLKFNDGQTIAAMTKQCLLVLRLGCSTLPDTAVILEKAAANQVAVVGVAVNPALTLDDEEFV
jgi:Mrp family chromosome partitioning ATPase